MTLPESDICTVEIYRFHHEDELIRACFEAQKDVLRKQLIGKSGPYKTSDDIISYQDHTGFYSLDLDVKTPKYLTAALNRRAKAGALIKLNKRAGTLARYTFPGFIIKHLINEIQRELREATK